MDLLSHSSHSDGDNSQHSGGSGGPTSTGSATKKSSNSAAYEMIALEDGFEPTSLDVICARGKEAYNHPGNLRFRQLVADQLHNYQTSTSKMAKSHIVREIIESVRRSSPKGGFVKMVNGKWWDVGERARREKTGQQIRDLLHNQYRSSTKAKARTRKRLRKSHSANSATRAATQMAATSASVRLPARIVTNDSDTNSAAAAAACSALAFQNLSGLVPRRNSEPDLARMAANRGNDSDLATGFGNMVRDTQEPNYNRYGSIRELEQEANLSMNRMMNMNLGMNMNAMTNMNAMSGMNVGGMNPSSSGSGMLGTTQGWGSSLNVVGDHHHQDVGFSSLQRTQHQGQLLQHAQQRQQLSNLSGMLQQPQASLSMPQHTGGFASSSSFSPFAGGSSSGMASSSHFDNHSMNPQSSMAFQSSLSHGTSSVFGGGMGSMQGMGQQSSFASHNTRPQDPAFSDVYQRSARVVRPNVPTETDFDPLLLPVDSNLFKEEAHQHAGRTSCNQIVNIDEDESEKSFEEAIDNIYGVDDSPRKRR